MVYLVPQLLHCFQFLSFFFQFWCSNQGLMHARQSVYHWTSSPTSIFFVVLGFELRVSHLLGRCSTTWAISPAIFFVMGFFEIGSHKLFGFEPQSSWSLLFFCGTGVWTQGLYLESLLQPFFIMGFFEIVSPAIFPGWLWTSILTFFLFFFFLVALELNSGSCAC
jgi:hypothetical protein